MWKIKRKNWSILLSAATLLSVVAGGIFEYVFVSRSNLQFSEKLTDIKMEVGELEKENRRLGRLTELIDLTTEIAPKVERINTRSQYKNGKLRVILTLKNRGKHKLFLTKKWIKVKSLETSKILKEGEDYNVSKTDNSMGEQWITPEGKADVVWELEINDTVSELELKFMHYVFLAPDIVSLVKPYLLEFYKEEELGELFKGMYQSQTEVTLKY